PDKPEGASPGAGGYWSEAFQRLVPGRAPGPVTRAWRSTGPRTPAGNTFMRIERMAVTVVRHNDDARLATQ
ncbi:hypothetical protein DLE01_32900, partial [Streptomyces sp. FT05W]